MKKLITTFTLMTAFLIIFSCTSPGTSSKSSKSSSGSTPSYGTIDAGIPAQLMNMNTATTTITNDGVTLDQGLRKLWEDHITWTRNFIISDIAGLPDANAVAGRLLQNQVDLGNAFGVYYGSAAGSQLTNLLTQHILIAVNVINAAKSGDSTGLATQQQLWNDNATAIAVLLNGLNPRLWPLSEMKDILYKHLFYTTNEVVARLNMDWAGDIAAYDAGHTHMLMFSDILTNGIVIKFDPEIDSIFKRNTYPLDQALRKLWEDHITWTRNFIISDIAGLADASAVAGRLLQNQVDLGNAIKPYYGDAAGNQLANLLTQHILIAVNVINAAKAGDTTGLATQQQLWKDNATAIAVFLNAANPRYWPLPLMEDFLYKHLTYTTNEVVSRLTMDWTGDIAAYDIGHTHMLMFADILAYGIAKQFPRSF